MASPGHSKRPCLNKQGEWLLKEDTLGWSLLSTHVRTYVHMHMQAYMYALFMYPTHEPAYTDMHTHEGGQITGEQRHCLPVVTKDILIAVLIK